jgi:phosphopantetheine adenylyltransferase
MNMADVNRRLSGIDTVILTARPELACFSSSIFRELERYGKTLRNPLNDKQ